MKKCILLLMLSIVLASCSSNGPQVEIAKDEVTVNAGQLQAKFELGKPLDKTVMLFGGAYLEQENAVFPVTMAVLSDKAAKSIYERHPDFLKCSSPGAAEAQPMVVQYNLIPRDGNTASELKNALDTFDSNLKSGGERVCLRLKGNKIKLKSVKVPSQDEDLTSQFGAQTGSASAYLVESADTVPAQDVLEGS